MSKKAFTAVCLSTVLASCSIAPEGAKTEAKYYDQYIAGQSSKLVKWPTPNTKESRFRSPDGSFSEYAFIKHVRDRYERQYKLSSGSCEAAMKIAEAYESDIFGFVSAKKWKEHARDECSWASGYMESFAEYDSELRQLDRETGRMIDDIVRMQRELGLPRY